MATVAAFSITPIGGPGASEDGSVSQAVAEVVRIVRRSGLPNETNAMFTNVEGELGQVLELVRRCTEHVAAMAPRVSVVVKLDVRVGHERALRHKVESVENLLAGDAPISHPGDHLPPT